MTIDKKAYAGDIVSRLRNWRGLHLAHGGELFEEAADEIARLREAIRRLADQDATLSVCDGAVTVQIDSTFPDAETLARMFHDEYERRAEELGYETRPDTRRFDPTSINGRLMIATCRAVMERISPQPTLTDAERALVEMLADHPVTHQIMPNEVATMRGLLERLGGQT